MDDAPRLATLDDDGWALVDAEARLAARERLYWLPPRWERDHLEEHVPAGGGVKLIFRVLDTARPADPATERMWVTLAGREGGWYHGHLDNVPHTRGRAVLDMPVWFRAEHVIDYAGPDGEGQASVGQDVLRCCTHGPSTACFVCAHIEPGAPPRGFNTAANAEDDRPDAWCDACDRLLDGVGGWDDVQPPPEIRLVCGGCYDALRARHERAGPGAGAA